MSTYAVPERLGAVVTEDAVYLMPLPDGQPVVLTGTAALIWTSATDGSADVARTVADVVGVAREEIVDDVAAYLSELTARGLLTSHE